MGANFVTQYLGVETREIQFAVISKCVELLCDTFSMAIVEYEDIYMLVFLESQNVEHCLVHTVFFSSQFRLNCFLASDLVVLWR